MDLFEGDVVHSHDYRVPETYKDKVVVCLGGNASGQDLGLDIAKLAKKVQSSFKKSENKKKKKNNCSGFSLFFFLCAVVLAVFY